VNAVTKYHRGHGCLSVLCVLLGRGLCDELITRPEEPTDYDASLCVIKKPREQGGHSLRWAAELQTKCWRMILLISKGVIFNSNIKIGTKNS
jgi:hypothetical protein